MAVVAGLGGATLAFLGLNDEGGGRSGSDSGSGSSVGGGRHRRGRLLRHGGRYQVMGGDDEGVMKMKIRYRYRRATGYYALLYVVWVYGAEGRVVDGQQTA